MSGTVNLPTFFGQKLLSYQIYFSVLICSLTCHFYKYYPHAFVGEYFLFPRCIAKDAEIRNV